MKRLATSLAALLTVGCLSTSPAVAAEYEKFGIAAASAELSTNQAGAHPDFTTELQVNLDPASPTGESGLKQPYAATKDIRIELPPGLIANLNAVDVCDMDDFEASLQGQGCSLGTQVGVLTAWTTIGTPYTASLFNLEATGGDDVARFGFVVSGFLATIEAGLRSDSDYGVTTEASGLPSAATLQKVRATIWGVPGDSSHDTLRLTATETVNHRQESPPRSTGRPAEPFMTNPTACGQALSVGFEADSYQEPGVWHKAVDPVGEITGCPKLSFEPVFSLTPTSREAAAPSGADATLAIPQNEAPDGLATSHLRDAVVRLPKGVSVSPTAADGLQACSDAQVGYRVSPPVAAACPEASKIATVEIDSPSLRRPLHGALYQRTPEPGHLTRAWLVADELGVHIKLPGEFLRDANSGQITSLFLETPQLPVRQLDLHFKGGARGLLATPSTCGAYPTDYTLTPWSGGAAVEGRTLMTFDQNCDTGGFDPEFTAGTANPVAAAFSSFLVELSSDSGEQNLAGVSLTLPPGVLAKLAGVAVCPEAAAATANCPADSRIGTTTVAAGPGPTPLWIPQPGKEPTAIYLAGPYEGGPYSLIVRVPAQAGPFDLGTVVVRAAIQIDPQTAQVSVVSDPLPQILEGIPVSYRTLHVAVDRPDFALNPTSCDPMRATGTATSASGASSVLTDRFQVGNCAKLGFSPALRLKLNGATARGGYPALRAVLRAKKGQANIGRVSVTLPRSAFLAQEHIRTVCTRVQFAADECPAGSIYGRARAFTPLLDGPLEGPVHLRSSSNELPDLVLALRGRIDIDVVGRIDSFRHGIRTVFATVPDAPVSRVVLRMKGGTKSLLVNSRHLCTGVERAKVEMAGHNGKVHDSRPPLRDSCSKKKRG